MLLVVAGPPTLTSCGTTTTTTVTKPTTAPATKVATTPIPTTAADVYFQAVAGPPVQRPGSLELTVDGTLYVSGVQWTSWGSQTATGSGIAHYHGCTPTCAQAPVHDALVAIRLVGIRVCGGRQYYSGVTLTLNSGGLLNKEFLQRSWSPC
jgi:hypothetical protein